MALTCSSLKQGFRYRPETEDGLRSEHTESEALDQWQTKAGSSQQALATLRTLGTTAPTLLGCYLHSEEPTRISSNGGLQSRGGHFRDSIGTLAGRAVMWPRPCLSGLADPAEWQRTQKTGSLAGSGRVACKPLLSQKGERSLPHSMGSVLGARILLCSRNMSSRGGNVYDRAEVVGSPLSQRPSRHTAGALPVLVGSCVWGHELSHPPLAAFPEGACWCHHSHFQGGDGCPALRSPPELSPPPCSSEGPVKFNILCKVHNTMWTALWIFTKCT